jgi:hypothetical protein
MTAALHIGAAVCALGEIGVKLLLRGSAMRRIVLVSLLALLAMGASAQRRGGIARGSIRSGGEFSRGRMGYRGGVGYGYGYFPDDSGVFYAYAPPPVFLQPPPPAPVIEPPPPPAHFVVTNYTWPSAAAAPASASAEESAETFGIVLKNGSTLAATAVVASGDVLHIVDPNERHMRVSMSAVDRAATMKLNRARKLDLYLPASTQ